MVHIGEQIRQILRERGMTVSEFSRRIITSRENVYTIFKRKTIDTVLLQKIGQVLNHNFFSHYELSEESDISVASDNSETVFNFNIVVAMRKIEELERSLSQKDELISLLKEKIDRLESKPQKKGKASKKQS